MSILTPRETLYFSNPVLQLSHDSGGYLRLRWTSTGGTEDELRSTYLQVRQAMRHFRTGKTMSIHQNRPLIPVPVQQWLAAEWIPGSVREAGYSHCAIVESHNPMARLASQAVSLTAPTALAFRHFPTEAAADAWLRQNA
ncbi:hypothetical protein [Hymenobacter cellulosilyticus]|uniref:STAS/SEC14 domain-containing protein n=1 Tax=Hymenobacter cellulosilyticus TaxID=2932248 RepID=A0A8T9QD49_9BACT|nr:hypothetical protein [Hymenobacter cellulosilyticus]UOQ74842.1 hypothetical protein MUN79_13800 [Hymenobacter cellulosilyticus]